MSWYTFTENEIEQLPEDLQKLIRNDGKEREGVIVVELDGANSFKVTAITGKLPTARSIGYSDPEMREAINESD